MFTVTITESLRYLSVYSFDLSSSPVIILFFEAGASFLKKSSEDLNVNLMSTPLISNNLSLIPVISGAGYCPLESFIILPLESNGINYISVT